MKGSLEGRLRAVPGVLDCSCTDAGVALVVHPEADVRLLQVQAEAVFAELGDDRPLVVLSAMAPRRPRSSGTSPLSLAVFAVAVLLVLAFVPVAPGRPVARPARDTGTTAPIAFASDLTPDLVRPAHTYARRRPPSLPAPTAAALAPAAAPTAVPAAAPAAVRTLPRRTARARRAAPRGAPQRRPLAPPAAPRHEVRPVVSSTAVEARCTPPKKSRCQRGSAGRSKAPAGTPAR